MVMEEELAIGACVRGYHVYKEIWGAAMQKKYRVNENLGQICSSCEKFCT